MSKEQSRNLQRELIFNGFWKKYQTEVFLVAMLLSASYIVLPRLGEGAAGVYTAVGLLGIARTYFKRGVIASAWIMVGLAVIFGVGGIILMSGILK